MIRELLNISRFQASDELTTGIEPLPLAEIVRNVTEKLMVKSVKRHVTLVIHADENIAVVGNGDQLVQLIMILGDNALKYSPDNGTISFTAVRQEDGSVLLSVADQGPVFQKMTCRLFGNDFIKWINLIAVMYLEQGLDLRLPRKLSVSTGLKHRCLVSRVSVHDLKLPFRRRKSFYVKNFLPGFSL